MGLLDFLLRPSGKARGWDALPALPAERKGMSPWSIDDQRAVIVMPLVSGPGLSDRPSGNGNSAVYACLRKIEAAYVEAPIYVYTQVNPKEREPQMDSPLQVFLETANPAFDFLEIMAWVQRAKRIDGNAYLRKLRSGNPETGNVVELWPISPTRVEPITTKGSGDLVSFYRYYDRPGHFEDISVDNIIHFRMGIDDRDHRRGCAPLKSLLREISSDDHAMRYADRLLANFATPGLSLEFDTKTDAIDKPTADELKARIQAAYGGDNVGAVSVLSPGAKLVSHGFSPEQMMLDALHRVPEERISAVLEVPAIVAGLGAGLQRSTFANFKEANESFIEQNILPSYATDDRKLTLGLARDFTSDRRIVIAHDISQMRALQDDENAKALRLKTYVEAGILSVDEARAEIGREPREQTGVPAEASGGSPLPAARSRPRIVTLPYARKALDDLPGQFDRLKDDRLPDWESELRTFLESQQRRAQAALRAGHDTAEGLVVEGEATLLGERLAPLQRALLDDVSRLVVAELALDFQLDDAATREYLRRAGTNIVGITQTTRDAVRAALIEGQANGEGIDELIHRLRDLPAFNGARARLVARTELGHAANTAALANYRASGVVAGVRVFDGDYDAACAAMSGRVFRLGDEPATLQHPNCLAGGSMVLAANVSATFARWFDGEVIVLRTASNDLLTCTPNHPILTPRGWVTAGALRQGDYVIRSLDGERVMRWLDPDHHYVPTRIEQVADTLWPSRGGSTSTMPTTAKDFHGDGTEGDICVVRSDCAESAWLPGLTAEHRREMLIQWRDSELAGLPRDCSAVELLKATGASAHRAVSGARERLAAIAAESSHSAPHGFGSVGLLPDLSQPAAGGGFIDLKAFSNPVRIESDQQFWAGMLDSPTRAAHLKAHALEVAQQRSLADADAPGELVSRLAGLVAASQIIEVDHRQFAGHVYNLEAASGWYIAENVITHNCRRAFAPIVDASEVERSA